MSRKWKGLETWQEWIDRDDRALLKDLNNRQWSPHYAWKMLSPWLHSIVNSLHFGSHSNWGIPASEKDIKNLAFEFLTWMKNQGEWTQLLRRWTENLAGPWSLPFYCARAYLRFEAAIHPQWRQEKSVSGQRQLLELPEPHSLDNTKWITSPILDAFSSLTSRLPQDLRLSYQLHLEGLLNGEIAVILRRPEAEIAEHIQAAKAELNSDLKKGHL